MSDEDFQVERRRALFAALGSGLGASSLLVGAPKVAEAAAWASGALSAPTNPVDRRLDRALALRIEAARAARHAAPDLNRANNDDERFPDGAASFSKGLPHDEHGLPLAPALQALRKAVKTGAPADFDAIPVGNVQMSLVNPQGGLAFGLAGLDACQFCLPPAPGFSSAERAAEAIELYWMAVMRDIPFDQYGSHPLARAAARELSGLDGLKAPHGPLGIAAEYLYRGASPGDLLGPYVSQFLIQPVAMGALRLEHKVSTFLPIAQGGHDYLTDFDSWLSSQNGDMAMDEIRRDPVPRYIRTGRDLAAYVQNDYTYQAFYNASIWLAHKQARVNPGSPYPRNHNQMGFATYGVADAQSMLAMAHLCALRAVWYQKWIVHRTPRPEEFAARVHRTLQGLADYPIHAILRASEGVSECFARTRGYLLPQAYPDGAPHHPAYAQGHAACAGACVTVLKAFYDGSTRMMELGDLYESREDGLALTKYRGTDAGRMTVASELDKLAGNIALGRNIAGIHWRSDAHQGLLLGEAVALALMRDFRATYSEAPTRISLTTFAGQTVTL